MPASTTQITIPTTVFDKATCSRQSWLVLLHAHRIPPHVGFMINGNYNSLTVKGMELNVSFESLFKMIQQKRIETAFIRIVEHPVFSLDYQQEVFADLLNKYQVVKQFEATCLTPIKDFFQEFYAVEVQADELLPGFLQRLHQNNYLAQATSLNFDLKPQQIDIPNYQSEELHEKIKAERLPFYKD